MGLKQDIEDAIQVHGAWKAKFRDYLSGKTAIDLAVVGQTSSCKLGKWLEQEGRRLFPQRDHAEICKRHAEFHHAAAEVTSKIKQKNFAAARNDLAPDGAFNEASRILTACLLKASLHTPSKPVPSEPVTAESKPVDEAPASAPSDGTKAE
jgi:hypothetical protein